MGSELDAHASLLLAKSAALQPTLSSSAAVTITVDGDGVACYDGSQRQVEAHPLGSSSSHLNFELPSVLDGATGLLYAVVAEQAASSNSSFLVCWPCKKRALRQPTAGPQPRTISDISARVPLPTNKRAHSLHALQPAGAVNPAAAGPAPSAPDSSLPADAFVALVMADGSVGYCAGGALELSTAAAPSTAPAGRLCATGSAGPLLLTLHAPPSEDAHALLRTYAAKHTHAGPVLTHACDTPIACPVRGKTPKALHVAPTYALIAWSSGTSTVIPLSTQPSSPGPTQPCKPLHFPPPPSLPPLAQAPGTAAHAASANGTPATASAKKRKAADADASADQPSSSAPFLTAPLDDTQFLVASVQPASAAVTSTTPGATHELHFVVLDRQFGVMLHAGVLGLEGATAAALGAMGPGQKQQGGAAAQPCLCAAPCTSPGSFVLQVAGAIFYIRMEAPPASLLSMVGRLTVNTNPPAPTPSPLEPATSDAAAAARSSTPAVHATLTPPQAQLDVHGLASTLHAKQLQQAHARAAAAAAAAAATAAAAGSAQASGGGVGSAGGAAVQGEGVSTGVDLQQGAGEFELQDLSSVQGLVRPTDASPLQIEHTLVQARLKQQVPPLSALERAVAIIVQAYGHSHQDGSVGHLIQQQQQQQQAKSRGGKQQRAPHDKSSSSRPMNQQQQQQQEVAGAGAASLSIVDASRLVPLAALACAEGGHWRQLQALLQVMPFRSLSGCNGVLLAIAQRKQYQVLALAASVLEDVSSTELVQVVQTLLAPTTADNLEPRKAYYHHLRSTAEEVLKQSEQQLLAAQSGDRRGNGLHGSSATAMHIDDEEQEEAKAAHLRSTLTLAHCAAAPVDGFRLHEVLLHTPLSLHLDTAGLQVCVRQLSNAQVDRLLSYLAKWVSKYSQGPLSQLAASNVDYVHGLPPDLAFPQFPQVLDWLRIVLDGHLPRLLMAKTPPPALHGLQMALKSKVDACQQLLPLQGAIEHVRAGAPLPHAHVAASTMYTVEYVDLGLPISS